MTQNIVIQKISINDNEFGYESYSYYKKYLNFMDIFNKIKDDADRWNESTVGQTSTMSNDTNYNLRMSKKYRLTYKINISKYSVNVLKTLPANLQILDDKYFENNDWQVLKYDVDDFFEKHIDGKKEKYHYSTILLFPPNKHNIFSGGELTFYADSNNINLICDNQIINEYYKIDDIGNINIYPDKFKDWVLICFPIDILHSCSKILTGTRYVFKTELTVKTFYPSKILSQQINNISDHSKKNMLKFLECELDETLAEQYYKDKYTDDEELSVLDNKIKEYEDTIKIFQQKIDKIKYFREKMLNDDKIIVDSILKNIEDNANADANADANVDANVDANNIKDDSQYICIILNNFYDDLDINNFTHLDKLLLNSLISKFGEITLKNIDIEFRDKEHNSRDKQMKGFYSNCVNLLSSMRDFDLDMYHTEIQKCYDKVIYQVTSQKMNEKIGYIIRKSEDYTDEYYYNLTGQKITVITFFT
jgi:hypothetical protein